MIQDYFVDITVKSKVRTPDSLGGVTTTYTTLGTVKGLLQRASYTERMIAAQRGVIDVFAFMTDVSANSISITRGNIVTDGTHTTELVSDELPGNQQSETMKNISQWAAETYTEETA